MATADSPKTSSKTLSQPITSPRGTQDVLPQDQKYWEYITEHAETVLRGWHFQQLDTPLFEDVGLFTRGVGEGTDIVQKEMYELKTKGKGAHYVLRPEGTASVVRAYIEHGMRSWPRPIKLFYMGPFFRYERPQAGRYRQLHQFGVEVFGSASPVTDAQVIYIFHLILRQLGLEDYVVKINSLGLPKERQGYVKALKEHYKRNQTKLCRNCKERLVTNPLRLLDCKEEKCQQVGNTAPRILDYLSEESKKHFDQVLDIVEQLQIPVEITPSLVRGLDYYTHTVFEFVPTGVAGDSQQSSLGGGGRYDELVRMLGGKSTPAVGGAFGIERIIDRIKEEGIELQVTDQPQIFVAQLGDKAKVKALQIMKELQENNIPFAESIDRDGMQPQLKLADRLKVEWAVILGQKEVLDNTVILRNMESGMQEVVDQENIVRELRKRLHIVS